MKKKKTLSTLQPVKTSLFSNLIMNKNFKLLNSLEHTRGIVLMKPTFNHKQSNLMIPYTLEPRLSKPSTGFQQQFKKGKF